jgi:hypothetical protein
MQALPNTHGSTTLALLITCSGQQSTADDIIVADFLQLLV